VRDGRIINIDGPLEPYNYFSFAQRPPTGRERAIIVETAGPLRLLFSPHSRAVPSRSDDPRKKKLTAIGCKFQLFGGHGAAMHRRVPPGADWE
jgi:hypothetical protein